MKGLVTSCLLLIMSGVLMAKPERESAPKTKEWDPTYTDQSQVVEWDSRKFKEFGARGTRELDGRKALGGKEIKPSEGSDPLFSKTIDMDQGRPHWLQKDFRTREARLVARAQEDWNQRQLEKETARGFDREYQTRASDFDSRTENRIFQGQDRDSGVMYKGPEVELIKKDLQEASETLGLGDLEKDHKLTIEKIKELLNKP